MNTRRVIFSLAAVLLVVPMFVFAQGLVPCGLDSQEGTINSQCQTCHAVSLINTVSSWLVGVLSIAAAIMFVIAGFRIVTAQGNPSTMKAAKDMIVNVAIGFMIVLAAWLAIDLLMRTLLDDSSGEIGPWNRIACVSQPAATTVPGRVVITRDAQRCVSVDDCAAQAQACESGPRQGSAAVTGAGANLEVTCTYNTFQPTEGDGALVTAGGRGEALCAADNPNCNQAFLASLGLTETQATVMSCIAVTENGGGASGCSGTGPCGTFQITRTNWRAYTEGANADYPECAASNFGGNLTAAQNNGPCNARVMTSMVRDNGYQPWTGANTNPNDNVPDGPWNRYARGCVNTHSNAADSTYRAF